MNKPKFDREDVRAMCVRLLPALARDCAWPIDDMATRLSFVARDKLRPDLRLAGWKRHYAARVRPIAEEVVTGFRKYLDRLDRMARAYNEVLEENDITPEPARIAACIFQHLYPSLATPSHPICAGLREEKMRTICFYLVKNKIGMAACS